MLKDRKQVKEMFEDKYDMVPSKTVTDIMDLYTGAHVKFRGKKNAYTHHGIVTDIDKDKKEFTYIHHTGNIIYKYLQQGIWQLKNDKRVLLVDSNIKISGIPEFKLLPPTASVEIAKYLMNNHDKWPSYSLVTNNCEHFVYYCTFGYAVSFQQLEYFKRVLAWLNKFPMTQFELVAVFKKCLNTYKVVEYTEGDGHVTLNLPNDQKTTVVFIT